MSEFKRQAKEAKNINADSSTSGIRLRSKKLKMSSEKSSEAIESKRTSESACETKSRRRQNLKCIVLENKTVASLKTGASYRV